MNPPNIVTKLQTVEYQDKRYTINRLVRDVEEENPDYWKSIIPHDIVLKKDGMLWFLYEITEVFPIDIIHDKKEEPKDT
jgi:hypothetical protein|tara:strand:- start:918 stop:1154 length:237 start_codon:yes stop_codon:yes gene_type:complete